MGSESFELQALRIELAELGASGFQRRIFEADVDRARAAIAQAYERGAGNPLSYAISLVRSETFMPASAPKPKPINTHGKVDPTRTDEGERIWQPDEVDDAWRHGYLADCIEALREGRDPAARYAPSNDEFDRLAAVAAVQAPVLPPVTSGQSRRALAGWATVWGFDDLLAELGAPDLDPEPAPVTDDPEPVPA